MRLTKEAQKVWDKFKREGLTEEEIFERVPVWPHEYESKEEEIETREAVRKFIIEQNAKRTPEEKQRMNELAERLRKKDEEEKLKHG